MYFHKKYMRLMVMASSVIAYSCYVSCQDVNIQENVLGDLDQSFSEIDTKLFGFLVREYADMLHQGINSEKVHELIQEKFKEKPEIGDKIWDKVQAVAAQTPSEASHAFGEKSRLRNSLFF